MKRYALWALLGICLVGAFLRTYDIQQTPPGLYPDEAMNGNNALEAIATGSYQVFYPENNGREGLFINIQALCLKLFGQREAWVLRLPSALFGILTILGLYFLAVEFFSQSVGLLAAFFLAVAHWHIIFSRDGLRVITAPFFIVWGLAFLLRGFRKLRREKNFSRSRIYFLVAGLFYGLGFHGYIAYRSTPFIVLVILWFTFYRYRHAGLKREFYLSAATFILTTIIVITPLIIYFLTHPDSFFGRAAGLSVFNSATPFSSLISNLVKTLGMLNVQGDLNWRHNVSGRPELFWPVGLLFWVGVLVGFVALVKPLARRKDVARRAASFCTRRNLAYAVLLVWLIVAAGPVILSNERLPHALRSLLLVPAIFMLAASGTHWAMQALQRKAGDKIATVLLAALVVAALVDGYRTIFISWAKNPNLPVFFGADYVQIGREINTLPDDVPKFVVVAARGMTARGVPVPAQTVMFLTDTFPVEKREKKNLVFISPREAKEVPPGSFLWTLNDIPSEP